MHATVSTPDQALAWHEAGHAVVAVLLDLDLRAVTIRACGDALGRTIVGDPIGRRRASAGLERRLVTAAAVTLYAGWAGEIVGLGAVTPGCEEDFDRARAWLATIRSDGAAGSGLCPIPEVERDLKRRAMELLETHIRSLTVVASELLRWHTLDGPYVVRLVQETEAKPCPQMNPRGVAPGSGTARQAGVDGSRHRLLPVRSLRMSECSG